LNLLGLALLSYYSTPKLLKTIMPQTVNFVPCIELSEKD